MCVFALVTSWNVLLTCWVCNTILTENALTCDAHNFNAYKQIIVNRFKLVYKMLMPTLVPYPGKKNGTCRYYRLRGLILQLFFLEGNYQISRYHQYIEIWAIYHDIFMNQAKKLGKKLGIWLESGQNWPISYQNRKISIKIQYTVNIAICGSIFKVCVEIYLNISGFWNPIDFVSMPNRFLKKGQKQPILRLIFCKLV